MSAHTRTFTQVGYTEVEAKERSERILRFETLVAAITPEKSEARRDHGSKIDWLQVLQCDRLASGAAI